jgi:catechol 1,2-dioxygenase
VQTSPLLSPNHELISSAQISHEDYKTVTTQIFPSDDPYLTTDTVFAVKNDLVVDFKPRQGDENAELDLEYNMVLAPKSFEGVTKLS